MWTSLCPRSAARSTSCISICISWSGVLSGGLRNSSITAFCFSSCSFIWRISSAALAASRSAIRRLRSAAEKLPLVALRFSDMAPSLPNPSASDQRAGVARDHQVLVGFYHICSHTAARRAYARLMFPVGPFVQVHPQPSAGAADGTAHRRRILTDASREDNSIEAAERRRERGDMADNAIAEYLDRKTRTRIVTGEELAKIG